MSLAQPSEPVDVSTRAGHTSAAPLADLSLKPDPPVTGSSSVVDDAFASSSSGAASGAGAARARAHAHDTDPLDLPLFGPTPHSVSRERDRERDPYAGAGVRDDMRERRDVSERPLVNPAPPRPPLAVRRPTGDVPRARARATPSQPLPIGDEPRLELDPPDRDRDRERARDADRERERERDRDRDRSARASSGVAGPQASAAETSASSNDLALGFGFDVDTDDDAAADDDVSTTAYDTRAASASSEGSGVTESAASVDSAAATAVPAAPLGARAIAALIDVAFLAAVDATVLHFTMRLTGLTLTLADVERLPLTPLLGFLALLNGGYLAMFTAASGQTMGKMLTGVKVVSTRGDAVPFGNAVLRAILWLLTIVPAGVGFIPALLTDDRRALHDRLADTRVVKVD